jgi:hypothetical protein
MSIRYVVLTILADCANEAQGGLCFPSIELVARRARLSERQTQRIIRQLAADEWLRIEEGGGRHQSNRYWLNVERLAAAQDSYTPTVTSTTPRGYDAETVTSATERVTSATGKGDTHVTPTGIEPEGTGRTAGDDPRMRQFSILNPPATKRESSQQDFDQWWEHVPKKVAKGQARKAWAAAVKKAGGAHVLIDATRKGVGWNMDSDHRYRPNPSTWLNGERWADDTTTARKAQSDDSWMFRNDFGNPLEGIN